MKKIILGLLMTVFLVGTLTACGKDKEENKVKADLQNFAEELGNIQDEHDVAINTYNSYFVNGGMSSDELLTAMNDTILPNFEAYIADLKDIEVTTDEVKNLKSLYSTFIDSQ